MRTSYSALDTFKMCPKKYKFKYIDYIKEPPAVELFFGSLIHNVLRFLHSNEDRSPALNEIVDYYSKNWQPEDLFQENKEEEKYKFQEGINIITNYYKNHFPSPNKILQLENKFYLPISKEHAISGVIDRIDKISDNVIEIIDYKTNKRVPPQKFIDDNLQLSIYNLAANNLWKDVSKVKLTLHFVKPDFKVSTERTAGQLQEVKKEILNTLSQLQTSKFETRPGIYCDFCGYKNICPLFKDKDRPLESKEKITKLTDEFIELKSNEKEIKVRLEEIREKILRYLKKQSLERIYGTSGNITRKTKRIYDYNHQKIKEILEPLDKFDEVWKIDSPKLKKLLKKLPPEIQNEIEKIRSLKNELNYLIARKN
ncbi:hypothetical protein COY23_03400 [bacterium (Candidatus Torokbacteria) CG_4_10_14_0_2_um_filter_35_8]|nr:MAG: hypothetical protein COY23_03400 [bacterium (Candidatus Torokbacteria) CG_4_10_14_0_2_um_filter_35_8]